MTVTAAYIPDASQTDQQAAARAAVVGAGMAPRQVPPVYTKFVTQTPGVVAEYAGQVVFIHDDGTLTSGAVTAMVAPLITQQAADAAALSAAAVAAANLTGVAATLRTWSTTAQGTTATAGNVVAVVNGILANLAVFYARFADLLQSQGKG